MVRLTDQAARRPAQLSGGQRQRVALARALVGRPRVLLLDEPLGALDLKLREQMQVELKAIQREVGITFVIVTHDQDEALTLCDRLAVFNEGRIEQIGKARDVYEHPANRFVADFVGTSNVLDGDDAAALVGRPGLFAVRPERIAVLRCGRPRRTGHPLRRRHGEPRSSTPAPPPASPPSPRPASRSPRPCSTRPPPCPPTSAHGTHRHAVLARQRRSRPLRLKTLPHTERSAHETHRAAARIHPRRLRDPRRRLLEFAVRRQSPGSRPRWSP